jgi:hypothetical protein
MNDLTQLLMTYYGIANYNSGLPVINKMIANYNCYQTQKLPMNAAWCAILLFNLCKYLNYDIGNANAWVASWCNVGTQINFTDAKIGDIVIIGNNVDQTHISTFVRWSNDGNYAYLLGGNQGQQLNIMPFSKDSIFKIIRLQKIENS